MFARYLAYCKCFDRRQTWIQIGGKENSACGEIVLSKLPTIQNPERLIDPVPAITRGNNSQVASTQLSSRRCFLAKAAFVRFADFRMGLSP
jgi:hypothetical protein